MEAYKICIVAALICECAAMICWITNGNQTGAPETVTILLIALTAVFVIVGIIDYFRKK